MLNKPIKTILSLLTFSAIVLLVAGSASAVTTHLYGELLTSNQSWLVPGNMRARVDAAFEVDPFDIVVSGSITRGAGLGNGYLAKGDVLRYTHSFVPSADVASIVGFCLEVGVMDDHFGDRRTEAVEIAINDAFWRGGRATARIFGGSVAELALDNNGQFEVAITATKGDLVVPFSLFKAVYRSDEDGRDVVVVPEPGAMALFCAGVLVVGSRGRRSGRR